MLFGIITDRQTGERWRVEEALNASHAWDAICHAICSGSIGAQFVLDNGSVKNKVLARVRMLPEGSPARP